MIRKVFRIPVSLVLALTLAFAGAAKSESVIVDERGLVEAAGALERLHSLIIAVEGEPVLTEVYGGPGLREPANIKSLSKTVLSAVVGAAIDRNVFEGPEQPITELVSAPEGASPRLAEVTVGHLLAMQAGLQRTSGSYYGAWVSSDNWVEYALTRPFVDEPGGRMLYSTGSYHVLSAALVEATGTSTLQLTRDWLGSPLNIRIHPWPRDPQGIHFGGNDMRLSPMALLQIGELYRNGGVHNGERVLSRDWIETSWQPRGTSQFNDDRYGYGWFQTELAGRAAYYGRGYGGQMLYVVPDLAMTVVMTADPSPPASPSFMQHQHRLMAEHIIPAVQ